jgi:hypothetical protein
MLATQHATSPVQLTPTQVLAGSLDVQQEASIRQQVRELTIDIKYMQREQQAMEVDMAVLVNAFARVAVSAPPAPTAARAGPRAMNHCPQFFLTLTGRHQQQGHERSPGQIFGGGRHAVRGG